MSYRKIEVNDQTYEYVIGKTNTKIKGIGVFLNERIESWFDNWQTMKVEWGQQSGYAVTPSVVRELILRHTKDQ